MGVPAKQAPAGWPLGVVRQVDGDIIVLDHTAHRIWRIDRDGILDTLAGDGVPGDAGHIRYQLDTPERTMMSVWRLDPY